MSESPETPPQPTRRDFLCVATCALGACAGAAALAPAVIAILSPAEGGIVTIGGGLLDLGPVEGFPKNAARKVSTAAARTDAYMKEAPRALGSVLVVRTEQGVSVFASVCPHAGCDVAPKGEGKLGCPCHESRFALDGSVEAGPSPRALDRLEAQVKDGHVLVKFERFQVGTADKKAL